MYSKEDYPVQYIGTSKTGIWRRRRTRIVLSSTVPGQTSNRGHVVVVVEKEKLKLKYGEWSVLATYIYITRLVEILSQFVSRTAVNILPNYCNKSRFTRACCVEHST